jgi:type I restriction enzyme M protein
MLRLNLILNNLVHSLPNVIQGDSLTNWGHLKDGEMKEMFDYVVSNPPFNVDFSESVTNNAFLNTERFFAGVPNVPKTKKDSMAIYLCFLQHILYILKKNGKAAVVVPTGFLTASTGIAQKIKQRIIDKGWLRGVVSMPSNIFANTGTNVSVVFIDKGNKSGEAILIDASKLGEKIKIDGNQKTQLRDFEIEQIVKTFKAKEEVDDFSKVVTFDDIKNKKYSLSAGQYFDIKIEYVDITEEEFNSRMSQHQQNLQQMFEESHNLENDIMEQLKKLKFNA